MIFSTWHAGLSLASCTPTPSVHPGPECLCIGSVSCFPLTLGFSTCSDCFSFSFFPVRSLTFAVYNHFFKIRCNSSLTPTWQNQMSQTFLCPGISDGNTVTCWLQKGPTYHKIWPVSTSLLSNNQPLCSISCCMKKAIFLWFCFPFFFFLFLLNVGTY